MATLKLFYGDYRGDNFITGTPQGERDASAAGYSFVREEGQVADALQPGTVPLELYWHAQRGDNFTTATARGRQDALDAGYQFIRNEGYVYTNPQANTIADVAFHLTAVLPVLSIRRYDAENSRAARPRADNPKVLAP